MYNSRCLPAVKQFLVVLLAIQTFIVAIPNLHRCCHLHRQNLYRLECLVRFAVLDFRVLVSSNGRIPRTIVLASSNGRCSDIGSSFVFSCCFFGRFAVRSDIVSVRLGDSAGEIRQPPLVIRIPILRPMLITLVTTSLLLLAERVLLHV
jgi:hypothetical protein